MQMTSYINLLEFSSVHLLHRQVDEGGCAALAQLSRRPPEPIRQSGISAAAHSPVTGSEASRDRLVGWAIFA